jgi:hypothetical protein
MSPSIAEVVSVIIMCDEVDAGFLSIFAAYPTSVHAFLFPQLQEAVAKTVVAEMRQHPAPRSTARCGNSAIGGVAAVATYIPTVRLLIELVQRLSEAEQIKGSGLHQSSK